MTDQKAKPPTWCGDAPSSCDICEALITSAFVDGATHHNSPGHGRWASMCLRCHSQHGVGLGTGQGQQYEKEAKTVFVDGTDDALVSSRWVKVRG